MRIAAGQIREHIKFEFGGESESGKTKTWFVLNVESGDTIGEIKWAGNFRKYSFFPWPRTIYDASCLHHIATFIEQKMEERKSR
jgi:hypothetical protein